MSNGILDLDALLTPIDGDNPAGSDLRLDRSWTSALRQIKDFREAARRNEKQVELDGAEPNQGLDAWRNLRSLAFDVLRDASKDLEIAACLSEALLRLDGFAGLCCGLRVARGLVENFWDYIYPRPDEDGLETTILPLQRLDGEVLGGAIRRVPITDSKTGNPLMTWQYRQAADLQGCSPEERQTRIERGAITKEMFDRAARDTSASFFQETYRQVTACREELKSLAETLHNRCAEFSPTFSGVDDALREAQSVVKLLAGPKLEALASAPQGDNAAQNGESRHAMPADLVDKHYAGREDAFHALESIAAFFEQTEPQSLIPAQLRKVVRWGRMSPAQLYSELIEDSSVREQIFKAIGIAPKTESVDEESSS